ncbi:TlpA disulfide reductase family protein [Flexithrix dorotheae]|uniref:TlpA disulfide reductase family protein n=1 Tax=Flexithrix dorotheae TaxID=70993 RepID=UPI0003818210|nr:TlpA disulfide reductase family protein [Flexithrix dorotheae]
MTRKLVLSVLFFQFLISFNGNSNPKFKPFILQGKISVDFNDYIYLEYGEELDSSLVVNNSFNFKGNVAYPTEGRIFVKNGYFRDLLFIEPGEMKIEVELQDKIVSIRSIEGNKSANLINDFMIFIEENESATDFGTKLFLKMDSVISLNPQSQLGGLILSEVAMDPILSFSQIQSLFAKLDSTTQNAEYLEDIEVSIGKLKNFQVGQSFKHFKFTDQHGKIHHTTDFKKDFLLIEFWASWCKPCRITNPELVKIYDQYKSKGLEIVGISLDDNSDQWEKAIKKDALPWIHSIATKGWESPELKPLGIQYVPSNFLLDKEGKILAVNIKPAQLEAQLNKLVEE